MPQHLGKFKRFDCQSSALLPSAPGLYAWYPIVSIGPRDWKLEVSDGRDLGIDNFRRFLATHTRRFGAADIEVEARGRFASRWRGDLEDVGALRLQEILNGANPELDDYGQKRAPKLQQTVESPQKRKVLVDVLQVITPVMSSPLYIGVAEDLSQRVAHHMNLLTELHAAMARDPGVLDRALQVEKLRSQFAVRALQMGFSPDTLEVWTLNLNDLDGDDPIDETTELRVVAEAAEWLMNRWYRPILGRR